MLSTYMTLHSLPLCAHHIILYAHMYMYTHTTHAHSHIHDHWFRCEGMLSTAWTQADGLWSSIMLIGKSLTLVSLHSSSEFTLAVVLSLFSHICRTSIDFEPLLWSIKLEAIASLLTVILFMYEFTYLLDNLEDKSDHRSPPAVSQFLIFAYVHSRSGRSHASHVT